MKTPFIKLKKSFTALLVVIAFSLTSCRTNDEDGRIIQIADPIVGGKEVSKTVLGTVLDEDGKPIVGAEVKVHGKIALTDESGVFKLEEIKVPENRCVMKAVKNGYFTAVRAVDPSQKDQLYAQFVMMKSEVTHSLEGAVGGKATLSNGAEVDIPAKGLVNSSGEIYTGKINLVVRYLNPTSRGFGVVVPGGDMLAQRTNRSTSILYSYGILRVLLKSEDGEDLQIAPGKTSTITMPVQPDQIANAPATIPLWYFDEEKGLWIEEGYAEKQGDRYIGTVKHFTDWNCDDPKEWAIIKGRLVDCDGVGSGGNIGFGQQTSDIVMDTDTDNQTGFFEVRVPIGITIPVVIQNPLFLAHLDRDTKGKVIVMVPPLTQGQIYDVGDLQPYPCTSTISGKFKSSKGETVKSMSFSSGSGALSIGKVTSTFSIPGIPSEIPLTLTVQTGSGKTITKQFQTAGPGETFNLGEISLDTDVSLGVTSFIVEGDGFANKKFTIDSSFEPRGWYQQNEDVTEIRLGGSAEDVELSLQFAGNSKTTSTALASSIKITDGTRGVLNYYDTSQNPIKLTITRYDLEGGVIEGTFSGVYQRWKNNKWEEITVKEGRFSVRHVGE